MTEFTRIPGPDDARFTEDETREMRICAGGLFMLFRDNIPPRLHTSVIASFVITHMMNKSDDPAAAWERLSKEITSGIATAIAMTDSKGSA